MYKRINKKWDGVYQVNDNGDVTNTILPNPDDADWSIYMDWLAEGNTPLPADEPPVVYSITPQQSLVAVGGTVVIVVTGAPNTTETITIDGISQDVQLDDDGRAEITTTCESAGDIYIADTHGNVAKVEVINV